MPCNRAASGQLVQLQGHAALLVGGIVLVQNAVTDGLIHRLDGHLVSALGLAAVALRHRGLELLDVGPECRPNGPVLQRLGLVHQNTLLGRLNVRQTKHLLRMTIYRHSMPVQVIIVADRARKCKNYFQIFFFFCIAYGFSQKIAKDFGYPHHILCRKEAISMLTRRTDLALEAKELREEAQLPQVESTEALTQGFLLNTVRVTGPEGAKALGKPEGIYHTLDLAALGRREEDAFPRAVEALKELLSPLLPPEKGEVLVVGLGNRAITPDAVGPKTADRVLVTRHLISMAPEHFGDFRPVAALAAGVLGTTGVESGEIVQALCRKLSPKAVVAVDALCARRVERLCATVQLSDTGISPGSGVGNHRFSLDQESLGVPVIALGVPTVVEGATLCADLLEGAGKELDPDSLKEQPGASLFVTPRDIDQRVEDMAKVMGYALSLALQPELSLKDLQTLVE